MSERGQDLTRKTGMSGGYFDFDQFRIRDIADKIERCFGYFKDQPDVLDKFRKAIRTLRLAEVMATRVDFLMEGDDGVEDFHRRWDEDVNKLNDELEMKKDEIPQIE